MEEENVVGDKGTWLSLSMRQMLLILFLAYFAGTGGLFLVVEKRLIDSVSAADETPSLEPDDAGERDAGLPQQETQIPAGDEAQGGSATDECNKIAPPSEPTNRSLNWERSYGSKAYDIAKCIISCGNGDYIVGGETTSPIRAIYLLRVDSHGNKIWETTYTLSPNLSHPVPGMAYCIAETRDGGYLVTGTCQPQIYILEIDPAGNILWEKFYDYAVDSGEGGGKLIRHIRGIAPCADGGFMLTGYNHLYKIDSEGNILWEKKYGDGVDIAPSQDGGFVIANKNVVKVDAEGEVIWNRTLLSENGSRIASIVESGDGGHVLTGQVRCGLYIAKIDADGNPVWERTYGGEHGDVAYSVVRSDDGGFVAAGYTCSYGPDAGTGHTKVYLLKVDSQGNFVWHGMYGAGDGTAEAITTYANGYVVVGATLSDDGSVDAYVLRLED